MRLKDKVCIITGAGLGIGRVASLLFTKEGGKVVVADINAKDGEETVKMVKAAGGEAAFVPVDVTKAAEVEKMVKFAVEKYGRINALYNSAGICPADQDCLVADLSEDIWDKVIDVNLKGTFLCCKYTVPELIKSGGGSIINVSSVAGLVASEFTAYGASKGGVISLTKSVGRGYANRNIRANVIVPGPVETGMVEKVRHSQIAKPWQYPYKKIPLGRQGKPEEIAYLALYLASDESAWVTGSVISIDGGYVMV
ncbi:SDR family NAD(P)-dependent oxidoreductase [Chloroflexota bacterium]